MSEKLASFSLDYPKQSGIPTDRMVNLYEKFGHGGFGMVITGNVMVSSTHLQLPGNVTISAEGDCPERRQQLARLAAASKSGGSLAIIQLSHAGAKTPALVNPDPLAPSAVQLTADGDRARQFGVPVAMTTEQVKTEVVDRFVFAAKQAYEA
ncbi:Protein F56D5.3, partial [Aphelenchoides avenae]